MSASVATRLGGPYLARLAAAHRHRQQALAAALRARMRKLWRFVDAGSATASWAAVSAQATAAMTATQAQAGLGVDDYVAAALAAQGATSAAAGTVARLALAGVAADGRDLAGLLSYPAFEVSAFVAQGMPGPQALAVGQRHLDRIVVTEVADAARTATILAIVANKAAEGFVRYLTPPSCNRCIVLAGKWYRYDAGFARHPQCDCIGIPAAEAVEPQSPLATFTAMTPAERSAAGWNKADQDAILEHGADISQVTNAKRDTYLLKQNGLRATRVGTTRRGLAGKRGARVRLVPSSIYAEAARLGWSREQLVAALMRHGFII